MIKLNELRIGNWVKSIGQNVWWDINGVDNGFILSNGHWRIIESFEPIPLTEEWMVRCAVRSSIDRNLFLLRGYEIYIFTDNKGVQTKIVFNPSLPKVSVNLNYLHQLQNLYFALTGEELNVNLIVITMRTKSRHRLQNAKADRITSMFWKHLFRSFCRKEKGKNEEWD